MIFLGLWYNDTIAIFEGVNLIYTALYRKLRPAYFRDVVGQRHIVKTLTNQIIGGRVSHAYLFCGVRGTGKTSCAKIFARTVNCIDQRDGEACGVCSPCAEIAKGASLDVVEIDAASNNGVDNIRDLREEVRYPPSGKYKVYIIDEVHMLSTGAFNALLKTLEEPPPHVIFILATTDPQKIPATIHSRLMRFDFHRISQQDMRMALAGYMTEEGVAIAPDALDYVVQISDGGMRDALSLLDRLAGLYFDQEITLAGALEVTGSMSQDVFIDLFNALINTDAPASLAIIEDISAKGRDFAQFAEEFLGNLRNMMIIAVTEGKTDQMSHFVPMITHFAKAVRTIKQSGNNARLTLEVACIEYQLTSGTPPVTTHLVGAGIARPSPAQPVAPTPTPPPQPQPKPTPPPITPPPMDEMPPWDDIPWENDTVEVTQSTPEPEPQSPPEPQPNPYPITPDITTSDNDRPHHIQNALSGWSNFASALMPPTLAAYAKKAQAGFLDDGNFYLIFGDKDTIPKNSLSTRVDELSQKMTEAFGDTFTIKIIDQSAYDKLHDEKFGRPDTDPQWEKDLDELKSLIDFDIKVL